MSICEKDVKFVYSTLLKNSNAYSESDRVKETMYHELTHAAHFAKVGGAWWGAFRMALISEAIFSSGNENPYGDGTSSINSPIIALAESWAYHMGHYMTDHEYGTNCSNQEEQGQWYYNNYPVNGLSSQLNLLEDFSPYRTNDPFHWIPQGLFYDLMDTRNENTLSGGQVNDNVSGYTNQEFFDALDNDVNDLGDYRQNLLQENGNNQSTQVNNLFGEYGY